jgi:hypothetical protein
MGKAQSRLRPHLARAKKLVVDAALTALPPRTSIAIQFWRSHKSWPDLDRPRTFSEKIQAIKLRGPAPGQSDWVDKVLAKERAAAVLGRDWIIPTFWSGGALPPRAERTWQAPYFIKANHGSGWNILVDGRTPPDWDDIERRCADWLRRQWPPLLHERQYEGIAPQLLVEPRLGTGPDLPFDYKFWVFHGRVACIEVAIDRLSTLKFAAYDRDWNRLPFTGAGLPLAESDIPVPPHFEEMRAAAETLGDGYPFVRVDLYDLPDGPRFGEMTFTPGSGYDPFDPPEWDEHFGAMIRL